MSTYLVLGASGFLGRHVSNAIDKLEEPSSVVAVSRRPPLLSKDGASRWVPMDLTEASSADLTELLDTVRPDVVINCVGRVSGNQGELKATNTTMVAKLIGALAKHGASPLIHLGSSAEYGVQPLGIAIRESAVTHPVGQYGKTKLRGTQLIVEAAQGGDIAATVLRVFNPVGPYMSSDCLAGRAARLLRLALYSGRRSVTLGDLGAFRDFVAASDVAEASLRAIPHDRSPTVLNVGQGVAMSCRTMVELLADVAGFEGDVIEEEGGSSRSSNVPWQQADVTRIRAELDWVPTTPTAQALSDLWNSEG